MIDYIIINISRKIIGDFRFCNSKTYMYTKCEPTCTGT